MRGAQGLAEKPLGSLGVARLTQHEVERIAVGIHCLVQVMPDLFDFDGGLVDSVRIVGGLEMGPSAFVEFGRLALDPAKDGRWYDQRGDRGPA